MNTMRAERLQETLYYDRLPNGLTVYVLPKPGFQKTYATFSAKYGSIDNHFRVEGKEEVRVPDGIAHFLEHKMFEQPNGSDVFAQFAAQGASANAFTSFDRTVYLFSATDRIDRNLETLLDFVQTPHFTDENVEKEKGIITQEIQMYRDNPDWRVYYGLLEALHHVHPARIDIAGSVESIREITKDMLYTCYHTFYHPENMQLFVVGGVQPEPILQLVRDNQAKKSYAPQGRIDRYFPEEPAAVRMPELRISLPVPMPKCLIGFKERYSDLPAGSLMERELETRLLFDILFSTSSDLYQKLYDERLITDQFGYEYTAYANHAYSAIGGETRDPHKLVERLREEIADIAERGIAAEDFERCRKKRIGAYLRLFNSPESIAHEFTKYSFKGMNFLTDVLPFYENVTLERIEARLAEHFRWEFSAVSIVAGESR